MTKLNEQRIIQVLKLAQEAEIIASRRGFNFILGLAGDPYENDWVHIGIGSRLELENLVYSKTRYVDGPWFDDLPAILDEIESEAQVAIVLKEKAREDALRKAKEYDILSYQRLVDDYLAEKNRV